MEEQKKDMEETRENQSVEKGQSRPNRSYVLHILAGLYLLYTGYQLCKGVLTGEEGASWGFMVAGILFLVIAVILLFNGGKGIYAKNKAQKEETEIEKKELVSQGTASAEEKAPRMSIAQRANLAKKLQEEENEPDIEDKEPKEENTQA
mgnify:FL=1